MIPLKVTNPTSINSVISEILSKLYGVPQRSIVDLLQLLIYVNDIPMAVK